MVQSAIKFAFENDMRGKSKKFGSCLRHSKMFRQTAVESNLKILAIIFFESKV